MALFGSIGETVHSDFEISSDSCILAPAGVPSDAISFINARRWLRRMYEEQDFTAISSTPDALSSRIRNDISRLGEVIRDLGLSAG